MTRKGVRVVAQRKDWDCGIAALAMLLDKPYGDIAAAFRARCNGHRNWLRYGMNVTDVVEVAATFGVMLQRIRRRKNYLVGVTGMLGLQPFDRRKPAGHWAIVKDSTIICPTTGRVWSADDYFKEYSFVPCTLLVPNGQS